MARTVELDEDVYSWLQNLAVPLEDTVSSVLRRIREAYEPLTAASPRSSSPSTMTPTPPTRTSSRVPIGPRLKLDNRVLQRLGVSHFVVDGNIPEYRSARSRVGQRAHERAYLDARIDGDHTTMPYFQRWKERGLPNPRGDAASRVILKVGAGDRSSTVVFNDGRQMNMADFVQAYAAGRI